MIESKKQGTVKENAIADTQFTCRYIVPAGLGLPRIAWR
jgi:hypothetical protein